MRITEIRYGDVLGVIAFYEQELDAKGDVSSDDARIAYGLLSDTPEEHAKAVVEMARRRKASGMAIGMFAEVLEKAEQPTTTRRG